jgi:class 3 adenylate cyclase
MSQRLPRYFLPHNIESNNERRKALLLINFILVLSVFSLIYLTGCYYAGVMVGVYTNPIMFPLCVTSLFVFKRTKRFVLSTNIAVLGLTAGIAEGVVFSGNIASPALPWLIASPSLAFLLGNKKSGIIWTVLVAFLFIGFGAISILNVPVPYLFPSYLQNYILTFTFIAVTAFLSIVLTIYNTTRDNASNALISEKEKADTLLLNILPAEVAAELKEKGSSTAKQFDSVTVLFTDFVNFTIAGERLHPQQLVDELHQCFKAFDEIVDRYSIEKIKTVGDAYLAVCGLPNRNEKHAENIVRAALEIRDFMLQRRKCMGDRTFEIRIGIHSGSVVAGIVGVKKFAYDIWGDTVNTAARMEQHGAAGRVNISEATYNLVRSNFNCISRGEIVAKNKGARKMFFVEGAV